MNIQDSQNLSHNHGTWTSDVHNTSGVRVNDTGGISGDQYGIIRITMDYSSYGSSATGRFVMDGSGGGGRQWGLRADGPDGAGRFYADFRHTHNMQHIHSIASDGGNESRPNNYTIRIYKRIS